MHAAASCCSTPCCGTRLLNFECAKQVPYGGSFHSHLQWDAVSVGEKQTRLRVSCEVRKHRPCAIVLGTSASLVCKYAGFCILL